MVKIAEFAQKVNRLNLSKPLKNKFQTIISNYKNAKNLPYTTVLQRKTKSKALKKVVNRINKYITDVNYLYTKRKQIVNKLKTFTELKELATRLRAPIGVQPPADPNANIYNILRTRRVINEAKGVITQKSVLNLENMGLDNDLPYEMYLTPNSLKVDQIFFSHILKNLYKELYNPNSNVTNASIQALYVYSYEKDSGRVDEETGNPIYVELGKVLYSSPATPFPKNVRIGTFESGYIGQTTDIFGVDVNPKPAINIKVPQSDTRTLKLGYRVVYQTDAAKSKINDTTIQGLKAFAPANDRNFHQITCASTSDARICIYESFLDAVGVRELKYARQTPERLKETRTMLTDEGPTIELAVLNGELVKALELLTKKYDTEITVKYFASYLDNNAPIFIDRGESKLITFKQLYEHATKKGLLYDPKAQHVAPWIIKEETDEANVKKHTRVQYSLKQNPLKPFNVDKIGGILGFDAETLPDENGNQKAFNFTVVGHIKEKQIKESFYGLDCIDKLVKFIDTIATKINHTKSRPKYKIPYINIYGFNNSRFDNLFIYMALYMLDPNTEFQFANNGIKYICYNNVKIFDISLQYKIGGLRDTAKAFKLEKEKGVYPYKFVRSDNLNYLGDVPDKKYWNDRYESDAEGNIKIISEYDEYVKKEGLTKPFNLKEYTEKYCLLDSELTYELAKKHIASSTGVINGKNYDVTKCMTSANVAIAMFQQIFQEETLYQSPDKIIKLEKEAFKGGRTEVFKKVFQAKGTERLYYVDINSAHPSGMTLPMPFKYLSTIVFGDIKLEHHEIVDTDLYLVKVDYTGTDKYYISNLLLRTKEGSLVAPKHLDYSYHWGNEIKEAILNGCEIHVRERHMYESKSIFKAFAEYFYNERLKIKKTNEALALFFKNVLNSLYGKFGQKLFTKKGICSNGNEMFYNIGATGKLISFEFVGDKIMYEYEELNDEYFGIGKLVRFSSYITATTRCKLSVMMRDVGHENVYYGDTDSIFTSKMPSADLLNDTQLGKWKVECKPIISGIFLAPKVYTYKCEDNKVSKRAKGVSAQRISNDDYLALANNEVEHITQTSNMFIRGYEDIQIIEQDRSISTVYNKRVWHNNNSSAFETVEDWKTCIEIDNAFKKV